MHHVVRVRFRGVESYEVRQNGAPKFTSTYEAEANVVAAALNLIENERQDQSTPERAERLGAHAANLERSRVLIADALIVATRAQAADLCAEIRDYEANRTSD
jgi:hypothetical protein